METESSLRNVVLERLIMSKKFFFKNIFHICPVVLFKEGMPIKSQLLKFSHLKLLFRNSHGRNSVFFKINFRTNIKCSHHRQVLQVTKCMYSVTIRVRSPQFGLCDCRPWRHLGSVAFNPTRYYLRPWQQHSIPECPFSPLSYIKVRTTYKCPPGRLKPSNLALVCSLALKPPLAP